MVYKYVCNKCGTKTTKKLPYGDYDCGEGGCDGHLAYYVDMPMPEPLAQGLVVNDAVGEVLAGNSILAGALRMVFNKTAKGRSAPGSTNVNHIHVGGNAQLNLLFDSVSYTVLGLVNGHMEKGMSQKIANEASRVMQRFGTGTTTLVIEGDSIRRG
ncbi:hypothetical protein EBB_01300 [Methylomonas sp. EbB]|uniref:Uncharacterized protein n=2 Tax=Methylomonas fluvii TaxID=1854564 RepID=A0ABR9D7X5_9GAMM|nr:hypothetical protein [Methylomonas fluvii]